MPTFGLIVEGNYDASVLTELIQRCSVDNIDVVSRPCSPKGDLMRKFRGFLEEFRWVKQGAPVDKALVIRDADAKYPQALIRAMDDRIADRIYPFPVKFVVIVRELETWLLADSEALAKVTARTAPEHNEPLEGIVDSKARLKRFLLDAKMPYTGEVARKIAAATNMERFAYRCPSFRTFREAVHDC